MAQENQITRIIELGVRQVGSDHRNTQLALAALAQENARRRVAAGSVTDLTDSSGGNASVSLAAVVTPARVNQDGVALLAPKATFDTQIGLIEDAHQELGVKASEITQLIASGSKQVSSIASAAAANDTIAAISVTLAGTAAAGAGVDAVTGIAQINLARNVQATIAAAVNWCRVAQGLPPVTDGSGGNAWLSPTSYGPIPNAAATAAAASAGGVSLSEVSVENALSALRNNIATLAAALTEANAPDIGPFVVATQNAATRFQTGNV